MSLLAALLAAAALSAEETNAAPDCATADRCIAWFDARAREADPASLCDLARTHWPTLGKNAIAPLLRRLADPAPAGRDIAACALAGVGAPALRALFDFMVQHETHEERWAAAQAAIRGMGAAAASIAATWQRIATDVQESPAPRIAALRGLEAIGTLAVSARDAIAPLAHDEDPEIREAAQRALRAFDATSTTATATATG